MMEDDVYNSSTIIVDQTQWSSLPIVENEPDASFENPLFDGIDGGYETDKSSLNQSHDSTLNKLYLKFEPSKFNQFARKLV